jgi:hypothetical protein
VKAGEFYDYFYLWKRQAEAGEDAGRKARPVCLAVVSARDPERLFLFPVTTQPPGSDRTAFLITEIECRRAKLRYPSWLILDEYNTTTAAYVTDYESVEPRGSLSPTALKIVISMIRDVQAAARMRGVKRDKE